MLPAITARRFSAVFLAVATISCQDNAKPGESDLGQVSVSYVCGNDFDLESRSSSAVTVAYHVLGTSEAGELLLPPAEGNVGSRIRLTTLQEGALQLSHEGEMEAPVDNSAVACPPVSPGEPRATTGEWTQPFSWPIVAVHLHLLPSGQVLSWGRVGDPQVWDPESAGFRSSPVSTMVFCSGHTWLADGRLLVAGGHLDDERGLPDANLFNTGTTWTSLPPMHWGRWYPTTTTLPDGRVVVLAGADQHGAAVETPEIWDGSAWRSLSGARRALPYYPRAFVAPNGLLFYAGELQESAYLDPTGEGRWIPVAPSNYGRRDYGSAVMYRPGKVLIVGGSNPPEGVPTSTAEIIDLNQSAPRWRYTESMTYARRHLNATLLPDGRVLVTGGTRNGGFSDPAGAVHAVESWDPSSGKWSTLASNSVTRVYHGTTLLLPDGRILHTGSGDGAGLPRETNAELFSPPYLFSGLRPAIAEAPEVISYGEQFFVATSDAGRVVRATLLRLSSVTHAFDQSQRFLELGIRRSAGGLTVDSPGSNTVAPPGPYLLFILTSAGVPSVAKIVRVG